MTGLTEPAWLSGLVNGALTPSVPVARDMGPGGQHRGSPAIAELACVAALSGRTFSSKVQILDPTVGRGIMLETVWRALRMTGSEVSALGIDINPELVASTQRSAAVDGEAWTLKRGNVLTDDVVPTAFADLVISEPPWGVSWRQDVSAVHERSGAGWYPHGVGRTSDAGWLFLQRGLTAMKPRGKGGSRFVTFVNPAMLHDMAGRSCRNWLVENDLLEAIVRLPNGIAENTDIPLHIAIMRTDKPPGLSGRAHVIDLRGYMTTQDRGARRRISGEGLRLLWSALETRRPGPRNRVIPLEAFNRQVVVVSPKDTDSVSFPTEVSSLDPNGDVHARYGPVPVTWAAARVHEAHALRMTRDLVVFDGVLPEMDASARVPLPILVCAPRSRRLRPIPGAVLFRSDLDATEVTESLGLPVTSPLRTAFDLARLWPATAGVVALDRLRALGLVSAEALSEIVDARPSWRGAPRARRATALSEDGVESPRESMMRLLWRGARLPRPLCNPVIRDQLGGFVARVDLLDEEAGLVGEYDGAEHASSARRQKDAARQERLEDVGLCVIRANEPDIATAPGRQSWQTRLRVAHRRALTLNRTRRWTISVAS